MSSAGNSITGHIYEFEGFRLDANKRLLYRENGQVVPLMPKAFEILLYLVRNTGAVIEKDDLMTAIWPDTAVEENNLTQNISGLRRVFGEKPGEHRFIATVPGRGYKFVADVQPIDRSASPVSNLDAALHSPSNEVAAIRIPETSRTRNIPARAIFGSLVLLAVAVGGFLLWTGVQQSSTDKRIQSLAVLPFKPLVKDHRDESLELGMADTLILKLNGGDQISVRPLATVRRFASIDQDPIKAGRVLGVDAVLDGSIQIVNDRVRISAKLFRVTDGKQLWSGQYDERSSDIFALQDSISERVASALQATLRARTGKNYTDNLEAYQLFTKGKFHSARLILPEVQKGIAYYEQAIAADPNYALAYVELSNAYRAMVLTNDAAPRDVSPKAKAAALKAVELDGSLSEAHTALAVISFWYDFDPASAETHHLRALELDPNSAQSHFAYAHLLSNTGRHEKALAEIRRALELDPVSLAANALQGQILFFAGKDDEALRSLQATAEMDKNFWLAPLFMSRIYLKKGMWEEAIASAKTAADLTRGNAEAVATVGYAHAKAGRVDAARGIIRELEDRAKTRYVPAYGIAAIYAALGENNTALDLLERSYSQRDALMVFLKVDLKWDDLRSEPRFAELMRKMNLD
ncbi:MAG TPA: winged helix-turn-helix domain-containing protein [Pyrinomonadaceae bacterium]|nr:winged helix-turn-helix domain-containing protein [Pyrinomonadaceae bacterium]